MRKYTTRLRLTSTIISCTFAAAGKRTSGYDIRSAAPSSRFVLPTPINLLRATTPLVSYIIHRPQFYYCCRFSAHTHTHIDTYIRSFHREIYFSFYFFPLTLSSVSIRLYDSLSHPHRPPKSDPYVDYITEPPLAFPSRAPERLDEVLASGVVVGRSSESSFRQRVSL